MLFTMLSSDKSGYRTSLCNLPRILICISILNIQRLRSFHSCCFALQGLSGISLLLSLSLAPH